MRTALNACAVIAISVSMSASPKAAETLDFRLEDERIFSNEILDHYCQNLIVGGTEIGWVTEVQSSNSYLTFLRCNFDGMLALMDRTPPRVTGGTGPFQYLNLSDTNLRGEILAPGFDYFSNHRLCGDKIAYWSILDSEDAYSGEVFASVFSLSLSEELETTRAGTANFATDNPGALTPPVWTDDCTTAEFSNDHKGYGAQATIILD